MSEFFTWEMLGTYAGCTAAVGVITQLIKGLPGVVKIPTQLVSYAIALVIMLCATGFTSGLTPDGVVLTVFNAAVVSLASNGVHTAAKRMTGVTETKTMNMRGE